MSPKFVDLAGETQTLSAIKRFDKNKNKEINEINENKKNKCKFKTNKVRILFSRIFDKHVSATFNSLFRMIQMIRVFLPIKSSNLANCRY